MGVMDAFKIDLLNPRLGGQTFEYEIGDDFFAEIDGLIHRGKVRTKVECVGVGTVYKFMIHSEGKVVVPCDRCLSDLELRIETTDTLNVTLGSDFSDDGDCVVVSEAEGYVDLAQFIYEFIALSMPVACCHEPGKCDDAMMQKLSRHQSTRSRGEDDEEADSENNSDDSDEYLSGGEDSVEPVDSRWEALRQLKNKQ